MTTHAPLIGALEVRRPFPARLGPKGALLYKLVAQAGRNIEDALGRAGATLSDIVSVRQWLTHAADIPAYAAVRSSIITHQPVFMLAVVPALVWPNIRVEIKVTAIRPAANRALMTAQHIYSQEDPVE